MTENPPLHDIKRPAQILTGDGQITTDKYEQDKFVVYNGQVAVGGSRLSHSTIVLKINPQWTMGDKFTTTEMFW